MRLAKACGQLIFIAAVCASCGGKSSPTAPTVPVTPLPPTVTRVAISGKVALTTIGETSQLTATATLSPNQKIDYIFLSPALWATVQAVDVERRGIYAPNTHQSFPEVTSLVTQASDHAAVCVTLGM